MNIFRYNNFYKGIIIIVFLMEKDITDKIVEDLVDGIKSENYRGVICIRGGNKEIRKKVVYKVSSKVENIVTDNPNVDLKYSVDLDSFIRMYSNS